jgi:dihydroorotase
MPDRRVQLLVRKGTIVTPSGRYTADLAAADGRIVATAAPGGLDDFVADETIDASGRFVLPGVIDDHVHFREPGLEHKEDWGSGSRSAVMGGVTMVLNMPNTLPPTSTAELVEAKQRLAEAKSYCDFGLYGLVVQENVGEIHKMAEAGVAGFKCYLGETVGGIPSPDDGVLLDAMRKVGEAGLRIGFHAENNAILQHGIRQLKAAGRTDPLAHVESRPAVAEVEAIQRVALFSQVTGTRVHIFHVSSRQGLETILAWRARGVDITAETCPQYCFLTSDDMPAQGAMLRINPPVREPGHAELLLRALATGQLNAIATDHSPHPREDKLHTNIWQAISGFAGVETSVRLFLTYAVNAGHMTLEQYVRVASEGPARVWGMYPRKGAVAIGADADLTIVDLEREGVIQAARMHGRNNHNPYEGRRTRGQAVATVVRGVVVMRDGALIGPPRGRMVRPTRRGDTTTPFLAPAR